MKTLKLGSIALLLLCGFISCKKDSLSNEKIDGGYADLTATSELSASSALVDGSTLADCPECVANFNASITSDAMNAVLVLDGSTLTPDGNSIKTIATTAEPYTVGNVNVTVSHDAYNIYFTFERNNTTGKIGNIRFYSPAVTPVPTTGNGNKAGFPDGQEVKKIQIVRSRASLSACSEITFSFSVGGGGNATVAGSVTSSALSYKLRDLCPPSCSIEVGDYRTQTRGYWRNNNGQAFLTANPTLFDLTIGDGVNTQVFNTPASVKTYLESGIANGTPNTLASGGGTFAAQVLTLLINVTADNKVADFSAVDNKLASLVVNIDDADIIAHPSWAAFSSWNGKSVGEILSIAQKVLGGTSTAYSPSHMNELLTAINENYDNATVDTGLLTCGK
jgi:hypothetical protein